MVMVVDIESRERRTLETLKIAKKEKTSKSLMEINMEVDKLAKQVAALQATASIGKIIAKMDVEHLTENLMRILVKLDNIVAEGDLKSQRREQCILPIETLIARMKLLNKSIFLFRFAFHVLRTLGVSIQMISQGASKVHISLIVNDSEAEQCVRALHSAFFETEISELEIEYRFANGSIHALSEGQLVDSISLLHLYIPLLNY